MYFLRPVGVEWRTKERYPYKVINIYVLHEFILSIWHKNKKSKWDMFETGIFSKQISKYLVQECNIFKFIFKNHVLHYAIWLLPHKNADNFGSSCLILKILFSADSTECPLCHHVKIGTRKMPKSRNLIQVKICTHTVYFAPNHGKTKQYEQLYPGRKNYVNILFFFSILNFPLR